jgi:hypothetical protein
MPFRYVAIGRKSGVFYVASNVPCRLSGAFIQETSRMLQTVHLNTCSMDILKFASDQGGRALFFEDKVPFYVPRICITACIRGIFRVL